METEADIEMVTF